MMCVPSLGTIREGAMRSVTAALRAKTKEYANRQSEAWKRCEDKADYDLTR
jgi:hypothetical protein